MIVAWSYSAGGARSLPEVTVERPQYHRLERSPKIWQHQSTRSAQWLRRSSHHHSLQLMASVCQSPC